MPKGRTQWCPSEGLWGTERAKWAQQWGSSIILGLWKGKDCTSLMWNVFHALCLLPLHMFVVHIYALGLTAHLTGEYPLFIPWGLVSLWNFQSRLLSRMYCFLFFLYCFPVVLLMLQMSCISCHFAESKRYMLLYYLLNFLLISILI